SETALPSRVHGALRVELRAEAIGLAGRGWPVVPGTTVTADAAVGAAQPWRRPVPVCQNESDRAGAYPATVAATWSENAYSLLAPTGTVLDALEVDAEFGKRAARLLRLLDTPVPIIALPDGNWLFLTRMAKQLPTELIEGGHVSCHSIGSWIPLPPTPLVSGTVHWRAKPTAWGWRLPSPRLIHDVLVSALYNTDTVAAQRLGVTVPSAA